MRRKNVIDGLGGVRIILNNFELLLRLGGDESANVFLARDLSANRLIAVKILLPRLATHAPALSALFTEARIAARIQHPNVVAILGFAQIEGVHCLSMEHVFGASLARIAAQSAGAPPFGLLLRVLADVCDGLNAVYAATEDTEKIRKLEPRNILVSYQGRVKIAEFAQLRAEFFGVGEIWWELFTGQRFDEKSSPRATSIAPQLPSAIDDLLLKLLAREPAEGYASAKEIAADARRILVNAGLGLSERDTAKDLNQLFGPITEAAIGAQTPASELAELLRAEPLTQGLIPVIPGGMTSEDPLRLFDRRPAAVQVQVDDLFVEPPK